ncbi:MAG: hypothetical protein U0105_01215 [Candidatus Obscuribacterales bacterium]
MNLHNGIAKAPRGVRQGALVSISVADGGVVAMVGGAKDFSKISGIGLRRHTRRFGV